MIEVSGISSSEVESSIPASSGGGGGGLNFVRQFVSSSYTVPSGKVVRLFACNTGTGSQVQSYITINGKNIQLKYQPSTVYYYQACGFVKNILLSSGSVVTSSNANIFFREYSV